MKNKVTRAIIFIIVGAACLIASLITKGKAESWSSFLAGFSFPLFVAGIIFLIQQFRNSKRSAAEN